MFHLGYSEILGLARSCKYSQIGEPLRFHRVSQQQRAGTLASGTAHGVPSTPLAAQDMGSRAGKLSDGLGGAVCGDDLLFVSHCHVKCKNAPLLYRTCPFISS